MSLLGKQSGPRLFVRLSKVSALEDVRLRQVLLYHKNKPIAWNEKLQSALGEIFSKDFSSRKMYKYNMIWGVA